MWPMLLDYTKDESKRMLRRLELGAYASIISVFRAQGDLSKEKKKILRDLQQTLSISTERHRAEVRRAVNDEKLATIADSLVGNMTTAEWMVEGRRLVPLMPRLVPQTAFTATANQAASAMLEKNNTLPPPVQTCYKEGTAVIPNKPVRSTSPSSNVVVLPSGTSIHIKGMLSQDEDEELGLPSHRRNMRSLSTESQNASTVSTQTPRVTYSSAASTVSGTSPVKITISKSPQGRPANVHTGSQPPKVILVTSAGPNPVVPIIQRSMSVPTARSNPTTVVTSSITGPLRSSVFGPSVHPTSVHPTATYSGVVTSATMTTSVSAPVTVSSTSSVASSPAMFSPSVQIGLGKVRPRIVPRQRYPGIPQQKPGVVIPMGPQLVSPSSQGAPSSTGIQTVPTQHPHHHPHHHPITQGPHQMPHHAATGSLQVKAKPTIQIKQEGGMKIITQGGTSKILPKPSSQFTGSGGTPVVMVNAGQSTTGTSSTVTMLPRTISTYTAHSGGKVLNITTPGGRVIATTTKATNVVTVNPKTLHLTAVKSGSGSTTVSKPNVIVVQKTQHPRFQSQIAHNTTQVRTVPTSLPGAIDKELVGVVHKESGGRHIVSGPTSQIGGSIGRPGERRVIITTSGGSGETTKPVSIIHRSRSDSEGKSSCLLTELIHAARIIPSDAVTENAGALTSVNAFEPEGIISIQKPVTPIVTSSSVSSLPLSSSSSSSIPLASPLLMNPSQVVMGQITNPPNLHLTQKLAATTTELTGEETEDDEEEGGEAAVITQEISRSIEPVSRVKAENGEREEQIFSIEQAMSSLNQDAIDLTEAEPKAFTSLASSNPVLPLPQISPAASLISNVMQMPGLPKVSILSTSQKVGTRVVPPANSDALKDRGSSAGPAVLKEDGTKEGHLDTQTGLFYSASPAANNIGTVVTVTNLLPPPPSQQVMKDEAGEPIVHRRAASIVTLPSSGSQTVMSATVIPKAAPTEVILAAPISPPSSSPPPPPIQLPSSVVPSSSSVMMTVTRPPIPPHQDILSSSLAQAGLILDTFDQEDDDDYEEEGSIALAMGEEEEEEEGDDGGEDQDRVDLVEPSLNSSSSSATSNRQGMAEVIREETAKDGTRILTVSNPASSQQDSVAALTLLGQNSVSSQHLVSLPSQLSRPSPSTSTLMVPTPVSSHSHSSSSSSASPLSPSPVAPFLTAIQTPELSKNPITVTKTLPVPSLSQTVQLEPKLAVDSNSLNADGFLPVAVTVEPAPAVITLKLDELACRVALEDQLTLPGQDLTVNEAALPSKITIHVENPSDTLSLDGSKIGLMTTPNDAQITASNSSDSQGEGLPPSDLSALVRSSKRKRKHPSDGDSSPGATASWVKAASTLLMKVCQFKGSPRDRSEMSAAQWFLFPVSPLDAPGYYSVVTNPMDFSTMRKKLKEGQYDSFDDFKADMELIQKNCYLYNLEGTPVRRDCDEVMAFYRSELLKINEKQLLKDLPAVNASPMKRNRVEEKSVP